jgi:hypothetical protein
MQTEFVKWTSRRLKLMFAADRCREEVLDDAFVGDELRLNLVHQPQDLDPLSVINWTDWRETRLTGRAPDGAFFSGVYKRLPALEYLTMTHVIDGWQCDIQVINGLSGSKSDLKAYTSLDELAEGGTAGLVQEISMEALRRNTSRRPVTRARSEACCSLQ